MKRLSFQTIVTLAVLSTASMCLVPQADAQQRSELKAVSAPYVGCKRRRRRWARCPFPLGQYRE